MWGLQNGSGMRRAAPKNRASLLLYPQEERQQLGPAIPALGLSWPRAIACYCGCWEKQNGIPHPSIVCWWWRGHLSLFSLSLPIRYEPDPSLLWWPRFFLSVHLPPPQQTLCSREYVWTLCLDWASSIYFSLYCWKEEPKVTPPPPLPFSAHLMLI